MKIRFEIIFDKEIEDDDVDAYNEALYVLFGGDAEIDWRDDLTVEVTTNHVKNIVKK